MYIFHLLHLLRTRVLVSRSKMAKNNKNLVREGTKFIKKSVQDSWMEALDQNSNCSHICDNSGMQYYILNEILSSGQNLINFLYF